MNRRPSTSVHSETECVFENKAGKNIIALWAFNRCPIAAERISCIARNTFIESYIFQGGMKSHFNRTGAYVNDYARGSTTH